MEPTASDSIRSSLAKNQHYIQALKLLIGSASFLLPAPTGYRDVFAEGCYSMSNFIGFACDLIAYDRSFSCLSGIRALCVGIGQVEVFAEGLARVLGEHEIFLRGHNLGGKPQQILPSNRIKNITVLLVETLKAVCRLYAAFDKAAIRRAVESVNDIDASADYYVEEEDSPSAQSPAGGRCRSYKMLLNWGKDEFSSSGASGSGEDDSRSCSSLWHYRMHHSAQCRKLWQFFAAVHQPRGMLSENQRQHHRLDDSLLDPPDLAGMDRNLFLDEVAHLQHLEATEAQQPLAEVDSNISPSQPLPERYRSPSTGETGHSFTGARTGIDLPWSTVASGITASSTSNTPIAPMAPAVTTASTATTAAPAPLAAAAATVTTLTVAVDGSEACGRESAEQHHWAASSTASGNSPTSTADAHLEALPLLASLCATAWSAGNGPGAHAGTGTGAALALPSNGESLAPSADYGIIIGHDSSSVDRSPVWLCGDGEREQETERGNNGDGRDTDRERESGRGGEMGRERATCSPQAIVVGATIVGTLATAAYAAVSVPRSSTCSSSTLQSTVQSTVQPVAESSERSVSCGDEEGEDVAAEPPTGSALDHDLPIGGSHRREKRENRERTKRSERTERREVDGSCAAAIENRLTSSRTTQGREYCGLPMSTEGSSAYDCSVSGAGSVSARYSCIQQPLRLANPPARSAAWHAPRGRRMDEQGNFRAGGVWGRAPAAGKSSGQQRSTPLSSWMHNEFVTSSGTESSVDTERESEVDSMLAGTFASRHVNASAVAGDAARFDAEGRIRQHARNASISSGAGDSLLAGLLTYVRDLLQDISQRCAQAFSAEYALLSGEVLYILRPVVYALLIHWCSDYKRSQVPGAGLVVSAGRDAAQPASAADYTANSANTYGSASHGAHLSLLQMIDPTTREDLCKAFVLAISFLLEVLSLQLTMAALASTRRAARDAFLVSNSDHQERSLIGAVGQASPLPSMPAAARIRFERRAALPLKRHALDVELRRRQLALFLYLIRSPIFDRSTYPLLKSGIEAVKAIPVIGGVMGSMPEYALGVLQYLNKTHFYNSNS